MINKLVFISKILGLSLIILNVQPTNVSASTLKLAPVVTYKINSVPTNRSNRLNAPGLNPRVLNLAIKAYKNANAMGLNTKEILTIVDYSLSSSERRLWVIDMRDNEVLYHTHVAHGVGSGDKFATKFSNRHGSKMSSIGMYLTTNMYNGNYGGSLNLVGLEENFNSNAEARRIVFHRAHYVDEGVIKKIGRLGRSFGCLALNNKIADKIMHTIKNGSLVFCYYPDETWLSKSKLL